jgi:hypothetical protein
LRSTAAIVFVVFRESLPIQTAHELANHLDAVEEISQGECGFPNIPL